MDSGEPASRENIPQHNIHPTPTCHQQSAAVTLLASKSKGWRHWLLHTRTHDQRTIAHRQRCLVVSVRQCCREAWPHTADIRWELAVDVEEDVLSRAAFVYPLMIDFLIEFVFNIDTLFLYFRDCCVPLSLKLLSLQKWLVKNMVINRRKTLYSPPNV